MKPRMLIVSTLLSRLIRVRSKGKEDENPAIIPIGFELATTRQFAKIDTQPPEASQPQPTLGKVFCMFWAEILIESDFRS